MNKLFLIIGIFLFFPAVSLAHSGGTAADGGHYCWTNCELYGVVYGERHFHNMSPSLPVIISYDQLHAIMKDSAGYKKVANGFKIYDFLRCKDGYTKKDDKCEKPKSKKLKASKESNSLSSSVKNERVRLVASLQKKRYITLEDLTDKKWEKYQKEILEYVPQAEIIKYAPDWFIDKYL